MIDRGSPIVLFMLSAFVAIAQEQSTFPIKRVVLYKNGVGYFEHLGPVQGSQNVTISFTSGQLNDVLKSLTVLDLNGGRVTGVGYGSAAPIDRQLGDLKLPLTEKTSLTEFLSALRGAKLEVRNGTAVVTGRLLSVERKTRMGSGATLEVDYVSLITDAGEVKTTEVSPGFSVKLLDRGLGGKVERYLDLISAGRDAGLRRMVISTEGAGQRSLFVSYISEVPVWKTTYRLVLGAKTAPLLQGWAIVDNTVGEDWNQVELSLVAGAPQSFIQNLSQPFYTRRPVVPLPESLNSAPQTFEATLIPGGALVRGTVTDGSGTPVARAMVKVRDASGAVVGQAYANDAGVYELAGLPDGPVSMEANLAGFRTSVVSGLTVSTGRPVQQNMQLQVGSVSETVNVTAEASTLNTESATVTGGRNNGSGRALGNERMNVMNRLQMAAPPPPSAALAEARARTTAPASAQELGDLFEYKVQQPITILKDHSALVPILQSKIEAEKVSVWNEKAKTSRPQRALWLNNTSGLTLDGGSFSVLEEETFAGEGIFEPIHPAERRLVSYATDLALTPSSKQSSEPQRVTQVTIQNGVLTQHSEVREKKTYTFRNEDQSARTVVVEHPVRAGYELRSEIKPAETTPAWMRFRLTIGPKQTASLVVEETKPLTNGFRVESVSGNQLELFVRNRSIDKSIEEALRKMLAEKQVVTDLESKKEEMESARQAIFDDQQRLRENMKALKGTPEEKALIQRYVQQLNQQEDRLEAIKKQAEQLEKQIDAEQARVNDMIAALAFDVRL
jgi:Carboxypeptidase regulatory-like domain